MSDNNPHHPGVRSLLAKFEGQSPIASPPSRGRSPAASDSSATARQLSKVRASFITVDGVVQSNPASPLRKTSGRSDSPGIFGPKINSEEPETGRQAMVSPTPLSRLEHTQNATLGQIMADGRPEQGNEAKGESEQPDKAEPAAPIEAAPKPREAAPKIEKEAKVESKSASPDALSHKSDSSGTVKKKPSSIGAARSVASKPKATAPSAAKSATNNTTPKPSAREVAKERSNTLAHKPSRVSLNPKTTTRPVRGPTPAQDTSKPSAAGASTRPARAPGSMAPPTQVPAGKSGSTAAPSTRTATTSTLHRKPSTLKSATGSQRAITPTASVRRQASRPSLPAQSAHDTHAKPVNEGFLARMMRPTASSANKLQAHEKPDPKPAAKTATSQRAPRPSMGRVPDRGASEAKPKSTTLRPRSEKSQASSKESAPQKNGPKTLKNPESEKENIVEPVSIKPKEPAPVAIVEQPEAVAEPVEETVAHVQVDESIPEEPVAPAATESNEKSVEVIEPTIEKTSVETSADSIPVDEASDISVKTEAPEPIAEVAVDQTEEKAVADEGEQSSVETVEVPVPTSPTVDEEATTTEKHENAATEPQQIQVSEPTELPMETSEKVEEISEPSPEPIETIPEVEPMQAKSTEVKSEEPAPAVQPSSEAESSNVALDIAHLALN